MTPVQPVRGTQSLLGEDADRLAAVVAAFDKVRVLSDRDLRRYDPSLARALRAAYGDRHRLAGDRWWNHPARVPPGPIPKFTAEVC